MPYKKGNSKLSGTVKNAFSKLGGFFKIKKKSKAEEEKSKAEKEKKNITRQRFFADSFFLSANAIISDGRIYNEDGASTRVSAMIYGPDKVFIVAGVNKIVESQAEAVKRTKWEAPQNCKRIGFSTPCVEDGQCHNCFHSQRSCCTTAILNFSRVPDRISVILVGEELGV